MEVAVIGAGLAGLTAARALAAAGHAVVVWEKSRGPGGRTATRRGPDGLRFDHGAPILQDGGQPLAAVPALAIHELVLPTGISRVTVGDGTNSAPAKALAAGLDVRAGLRVGALAADGRRWRLAAADGAALATVDAVVVTAPAPQAAELLAGAAPILAAAARTVAYDPCWTVMAAWERPLGLAFTGARDTHDLAWAVAEAPKPGRAAGERWVLQAGAELSVAHLEAEPEAATDLLLERFARLAGGLLPAPVHAAAHRWRFSRPVAPLAEPALQADTLVAAGDWCGGDDAGAAVRSGAAAAALLS